MKDVKNKRNGDSLSEIEKKEKQLIALLYPMENFILSLQRVLIWQDYVISGLAFAAVTIVFFYIWICQFNFLSVVGFLGLLLVSAEGLKTYYWPYIRGEDASRVKIGSTEANPNIKSVAEIARKAAEMWQAAANKISDISELRRKNKPKFFVSSVLILSGLAFVGVCFSGITLVFMIVMSILIGPGIQDFYKSNKHRVKDIPSRANVTMPKSSQVTPLAHEPDSDDEDLREFLPTKPLVIARPRYKNSAGTLKNRTDDKSHPKSGRLQQITEMESSMGFSEDDMLSSAEMMSSFTEGLGPEMPSIDSNFDSITTFIPDQREMPSFDHFDHSLMSKFSGNFSFASTDFTPTLDDDDDTDTDEINNPQTPNQSSINQSSINQSSDETYQGMMTRMLGDIISQGGSTLASAAASYCPSGVSDAISVAAEKIGNVATIVKDAAGYGGDSTPVAAENAEKYSGNKMEDDFEIIDDEEIEGLKRWAN